MVHTTVAVLTGLGRVTKQLFTKKYLKSQMHDWYHSGKTGARGLLRLLRANRQNYGSKDIHFVGREGLEQ